MDDAFHCIVCYKNKKAAGNARSTSLIEVLLVL